MQETKDQSTIEHKDYRPWASNKDVPMPGFLIRRIAMPESVCLVLRVSALEIEVVQGIYWDYLTQGQTMLDICEHSIDGGKTWLPCGVKL